MTRHEQVRATVFRVLDDLNGLRTADGQLAKDDGQLLVGEGGQLDSLGLVNLIALLEERVQDEFDRSLNLMDAISDGAQFESVGELVALVCGQLGDTTHV